MYNMKQIHPTLPAERGSGGLRGWIPGKGAKLPLVLFLISIFILLIYTRLVNLGWGLPYPMHPDERNMVLSIIQLKCDTTTWVDCLHPHFFAYGQLPMYTAYFLVKITYFFQGDIGKAISFEDATLALRFISAICSVAAALFMYHSLSLLSLGWFKKKRTLSVDGVLFKRLLALTSLVIVFVPGFIQLAHFGTTESILMTAYSALIWLSLVLFNKKIAYGNYVLFAGIVTGMALASKVSALPFGLIPLITLAAGLRLQFPKSKKALQTKKGRSQIATAVRKLAKQTGFAFIYGGISFLLAFLLSPYNWLYFSDFYSSMQYESGVGFGTFDVFYTRSFFITAPVLFQFGAILPYVLGLPVLLLFIAGFLLLPWKSKSFVLLRIAFLLYFLPQAFLYAKWTRFIAPVFPVAVLIAAAFLVQVYFFLREKVKAQGKSRKAMGVRAVYSLLVLVAILPGMAFLSVYTKPDVRYYASYWMFQNIPEGSTLLAETANVVDVPIVPPDADWQTRNFNYISFDFYNLDTNPMLTTDLQQHLSNADYIVVNTRRVFKNHTCFVPDEHRFKPLLSIDQRLPLPLFTPVTDQAERCSMLQQKYPQLQKYYSDLFSGKGGFVQVAEFASYPEISLFGQTLIEFPDENAEETWSVFDHPVVRIYKRKEN